MQQKSQNAVSTVQVVQLHVELQTNDISEQFAKHADSSACSEQIVRCKVLEGHLPGPEVEVEGEADGVQGESDLVTSTDKHGCSLPSDVVLLLRVKGKLIVGTDIKPRRRGDHKITVGGAEWLEVVGVAERFHVWCLIPIDLISNHLFAADRAYGSN